MIEDIKLINELNGDNYLNIATDIVEGGERYSDVIRYIAESRLNNTGDGFIPGPNSIKAAEYAMSIGVTPDSYDAEDNKFAYISYAHCQSLSDFVEVKNKIDRLESILSKYKLTIEDLNRFEMGLLDETEIEIHSKVLEDIERQTMN